MVLDHLQNKLFLFLISDQGIIEGLHHMYMYVISNLYSAAHSRGHSVALPVREPREKK